MLSYAGLDTAFQFAIQRAPSFGGGSVPAQTARAGTDIRFQVPAASHGAGAVVYSVEGLPPGIAFDADGTGACSAARTICGRATLVGESAVTVWATDAVGAKRTALNFTITVTAADPPIAAAHAVTLGATTRAATLDPPTIVVDEGAASTYTVVLPASRAAASR